jgi:carbon monoxide dehydrogenase subunit G
MKVATTSRIPAPRDAVFAALIDPAVLQRAIPGCESLVAVGIDDYEAAIRIGVAGLKGTYTGTAQIREKAPPESLRLSFAGKGGPGFVRGSAAIRLSEDDGVTVVTSEADVQVGGLIAAVGSRLIEAGARKLTDDFFSQLAREIRP